MSLEIAVILLLVFIMIYYILIKIFSILFRITGLTREKSIFQTISLLTNSGFTTGESEIITRDRTRRRIANFAMLTGYAFSVVIISLILNMLTKLTVQQEDRTLIVISISAGAFVLFFVVSKLPFVRKPFEALIEKVALALLKRGKNENVITLLDNYGKDAIAEVLINKIPEMIDSKTLFEAQVRAKYNVNVLMIQRKGRVIEVDKNSMVQKGDILVVFGSHQNIKDMFGKKGEFLEEAIEIDSKENIVELIDNYGQDAMAEVKINTIPSILNEKTVFESGLKNDFQINILVLRRNDKPIPVQKDTTIEVGDELVVFGPYKKVKEVFLYSDL